MPTIDQSRLMDSRAHPRILDLWWALRPLTSVVRFMQSGAHPDDEDSGMLAALALRDGINLSYACSTRGEGGQNDIGTEAGTDLGALRTKEMERACDVLGMRLYWHSERPEDPITDFGFSKSGIETLSKWGHDRTLARFVEIIRTDRPDCLCPTFLDVPGQHGHHRAMTQAAHEVMALAADPDFPSDLPPWQIKKLYLPAWSGAGRAYDDDEAPPPATLVIDGSGRDPISGWRWDQIGQMSRAYHQTQGMGRWVPPGKVTHWPLHLVHSHATGPDDAVWSGLAQTVGDLAQVPGGAPLTADLYAAQAGIDQAVAAYPDFDRVATAAVGALQALRRAQSTCPTAARYEIVHRLAAKEVQLGRVISLALGLEVRARLSEVFLRPGQRVGITIEADAGAADGLSTAFDLPQGWTCAEGTLALSDHAQPSTPYRAVYDPAVPSAPALDVTIKTGTETVGIRVPFDVEPVVLPAKTATITPQAVVVNRAKSIDAFAVAIKDVHPTGAVANLDLPAGWGASQHPEHALIAPPGDVAEGLYHIGVRVDGHPALSVRRIEHAHVAPTAQTHATKVRVRVLDVIVPNVRIGYVGAGNDQVGYWLSAMGADVTDLSDEMLGSDAALAAFDTIVIGIFAMRFRPGLVEAVSRLHRWTKAGGTLVTLYHRPWDNWDPDTVPPKRIEIGQPSLRWRVTDEKAVVRHLTAHPVLTTPNQIGPADWDGWVKERGLYFAKSWDDAYVALLEMADPDESPHKGALLVADIGKGRHVHTSLILHHQMDNLVAGAFRLMANLIAKRA